MSTGIVQIEVTYLPYGTDIQKLGYYSFGDFESGAGSICCKKHPEIAHDDYDFFVSRNLKIKRNCIIYEWVGFVGNGDGNYSSEVEWDFLEGFPDEYLRDVIESLWEYIDKRIENHKQREKSKDILRINFGTVWNFWSSFDSYNNEYDCGSEFEGILDMSKISTLDY